MRRVRKLISVLAMMTLVAGFAVTSSFAVPIGPGVATSTDTQITVPKGVTFINDDAVTSYGPGITYTYTVAPATVTDGAMTVKDAEGNSTTVHAGPAGGLTLAANSLAFPSSETFTTTAAGQEHTKNIVMNVDLERFARAGVYRYVLTDTTPKADLFAAGITRDDNYDVTRFIDVFVRRNASGSMEVYGYALKTDNSSTDGTATPPTAKDPGYVAASDAEDGTPAATDRYKTYNVTLTKNVSGTLGDFEHEFPFALTVANDDKNYYAAKGDINAAKAATADAQTSKSTTLKHTEVYTLAGLSPHATVAYQETNDTTDLYAVTAAGSTAAITVADDGSKHYSVAAGAVSTYDTANSATSVAAVGAATNYSAVTYTNTLDEVSPTGFVQHFGMLMLIMVAAFALLLAGMKTTEDEEL